MHTCTSRKAVKALIKYICISQLISKNQFYKLRSAGALGILKTNQKPGWTPQSQTWQEGKNKKTQLHILLCHFIFRSTSFCIEKLWTIITTLYLLDFPSEVWPWGLDSEKTMPLKLRRRVSWFTATGSLSSSLHVKRQWRTKTISPSQERVLSPL